MSRTEPNSPSPAGSEAGTRSHQTHELRVKICGVCRPSDAELALRAGADYIGVIVAGPGPRVQGARGAAAVFENVPAAARVGVFVDVDAGFVIDAARTLSLTVVQLHGVEPPEYVQTLTAAGLRVWKAVRFADRCDLEAAIADYGGIVDALLLDGGTPQRPGGTGSRFDWHAVAAARGAFGAVPLIAAGGLNAGNVAAAVQLLGPAVVDVSSGVEEAAGRKSMAKVQHFVAAARDAAAALQEGRA